ncbi:MAG: protein kinase family protein [Planctomycetota bacterium]|jgi:serine/threonine protein kinase
MSLPSELIINNAVSSVGDIVIYQGEHPIHGAVSVYKPDTNLPPDVARAARSRLYQEGLRLREISLSNPRFVSKALEVSQNPKEPYIVTEYANHDLEELIGNGITMRPKRMFTILSQILEGIADSAANGWVIGHIQPRQIKLQELDEGDISLSLIEGAEDETSAGGGGFSRKAEQADSVSTMTAPIADSPASGAFTESAGGVQKTGQSQPSENAIEDDATSDKAEATVAVGADAPTTDAEKQLWAVQRNIYTLGNITYQLLFGRKYESSDEIAQSNIKRLAGRWRRIAVKALSEDIERRYSTYEGMLRDVKKSTSRNRRMAIASTPFLLILVVIAGYLGYEKYREHKIMTSDASQAIESFLEVITETQDEVPELKKPDPQSLPPDEETILDPFKKIEAADES